MTDPATIVRIAAKGDGVTADGRHVPLSAPGDRLGEDGKLIPGPHHAQPPCRHFPECGGCQLQHLDDESYAAYVRDRVAGALAGQEVEAGAVLNPHVSPPRTRRRASLRATRAGGRMLLGFSEGSSNRIVDMRMCEVLHPALFDLVEPLRDLLSALVSKGGARVAMTLADQGVDIALEGIEADGLAMAERLTAFAAEHRLARLTIDDGYGPQVRFEPDPVTITLGGVAVPLPGQAFLQATADGEKALIEAVRPALADAAIWADLFAGLGTFALALGEGRKVYAAEASRDLTMALKAGANRVQRPVGVDHRDLFRRPLTPDELNRFDAILLDPPRAGAREQADQLAAARVPVIAYVSCNPSSFARDAKRLVEGGYRLESAKPVGQFRWSTHVELAAIFRRI